MNGETGKLKKYAPVALRTGIAIVFLWFAFSQIKNAGSWTRMIPSYVTSIVPFSSNTLVYMNAAFEIIFASLLLVGLYTRLASGLLTLHLLHIVTILGYGPTGVRDFSLVIATLSIFLAGADEFCLDRLIGRSEVKEIITRV